MNPGPSPTADSCASRFQTKHWLFCDAEGNCLILYVVTVIDIWNVKVGQAVPRSAATDLMLFLLHKSSKYVNDQRFHSSFFRGHPNPTFPGRRFIGLRPSCANASANLVIQRTQILSWSRLNFSSSKTVDILSIKLTYSLIQSRRLFDRKSDTKRRQLASQLGIWKITE